MALKVQQPYRMWRWFTKDLKDAQILALMEVLEKIMDESNNSTEESNMIIK